MTCFKKLWALLLAAGMALTLLAGCCSPSLLRLLLDLLQDQYQNITVTAEDDLEATLRQAVSQNDTMEEITAALAQALDKNVEFQSLRSARAGDQTFSLVFKTGTDTEAIARQTYTDWNQVLGSLPPSGQYLADLATLKADGGYYILVNVTVKRGGSSGSSDDSSGSGDENDGGGNDGSGNDDQDDQDKEEILYGVFKDGTETVTLEPGKKYVVYGKLAKTLSGALICNDPNNPATVRIQSYASLFGTITGTGRIENINFVMDLSANLNFGEIGVVGALAGVNGGTIANCTLTHASNNRIKANSWAGGLVGENSGTIEYCNVVMSGSDTKVESTGSAVGGIAGHNTATGKIQNCHVTCEGSTRIEGYTHAGGIVGKNDGGSISSCEVTVTGSITAFRDKIYSTYAGGIAGENNGTIASNCTVTLKGDGTIESTMGTDTATVSAKNGKTTDMAPESGSYHAYAGTKCGYDSSTGGPC